MSVDMLRVTPHPGEREVKKDNMGTMQRLEEAKPGGVGDVQCPDGSSCSDGTTCCLYTTGDYACCPNAYGNCCDDYLTCCPSGTVCDDANDQCLTAGLESLNKIPFLVKPPKPSSNSNQPRL